jgi:predicted nucleic acid-binding protein
VRLYAESSAVLRWLLGAPRADEIRAQLMAAEHVFTSRLTLLEVRRALIRTAVAGDLTETDALLAGTAFSRAAAHWSVAEVLPEIMERAGQRFPVEPVRSLDALHLATALLLVPSAGRLAVLSTGDRIVRNAPLLGLDLCLSPRSSSRD